MLLCFYQSQLGLLLDPVFCSHWKKKKTTLIWLPCWSKPCGLDVEGPFSHNEQVSPVCLLILGQISAGPQICPYDSGKGWNRNSKRMESWPWFSAYYCKALGHHVSLPGLRVLICAKAALDQMVPWLFSQLQHCPSVFQPQTHGGSLWLYWWVTYTSESCHPKPREQIIHWELFAMMGSNGNTPCLVFLV